MNVFVNTRLLPEDAQAQSMEQRAAALLSESGARADAVSEAVMAYLRRHV